MLDLYLNNRHRRENSSSMELTWFSSNSQRTRQVSQIAGSSRLGGNVSRQVSLWEIINMEPLLGMTFAPYCYKGSEPSDDEDEHHINRVVFDGEDEDDRDDRDVKLV